jgi:hypothetical protein
MGLLGVPRQLADKAKDAVSGFGSGGGGGGAVSPLAACYLSSCNVCAQHLQPLDSLVMRCRFYASIGVTLLLLRYNFKTVSANHGCG